MDKSVDNNNRRLQDTLIHYITEIIQKKKHQRDKQLHHQDSTYDMTLSRWRSMMSLDRLQLKDLKTNTESRVSQEPRAQGY